MSAPDPDGTPSSPRSGVPGGTPVAATTLTSTALQVALPPSSTDPTDDPATRRFLDELVDLLEGEVDATRGTRARFSTDAGNYRVPPLAVVFPAGTDDVVATLGACRRWHVPVTNRGGGTSCAGNAIGPGVVLDFSRHMNRVLSLDPAGRTAVVEPGCVQATLQKAAAPHGLRFGPDPSSQNRATIGGMVGNNACGPHATAWGRTADNIISLECVDGRGRRFTARTSGDLSEVPGLGDLVRDHLALVRTELGTFGRQVSGYSLEHLTPEGHGNLAAMLVGTEGTLVTVLEVTVRLVDLPTAPVLVALGYPDMIAAADDVPALLVHHPLAVEGMDSRLVDVVRHHAGPGAVPTLPEGNGRLMCEVGGTSPEDSLARAHALAADAHTDAVAVYPPGSDATALWRIRADGAGLGGRTPIDAVEGTGNEQAWPGFEDAAVPPANLGAYLRDFTALMEDFHVDGLLYGHFGDGCVHVRLDLPLDSDEGVAHSRRFLERAAQVCASHGGSVSGEHGDGRARTELLRYMYSPELLELFARVKDLFDPEDLLNPGVLTGPLPSGSSSPEVQPGIDLLDQFLRRPAARPLPAAGGFAFREDHGDFTTAVHRCTGVGKCRADIAGTFMCPSWKATRDEKDVTRGRARTLQDAANGELIASVTSPEVLEALDLCLACKACSSDCPAGVDMAKYRSETLFRRYRGHRRPLTHYTLGRLPMWTRLTARVPGLAQVANAVMGVTPLRRLAFSLIGLDPRRPMPHLQSGTFQRWAAHRGLTAGDPASTGTGSGGGVSAGGARTAGTDGIPGAGPAPRAQSRPPRHVVVWADSFSQTLDDSGARALVDVLEANGFTVLLPPDACCGLTWITTGQLDGAKKRLTDLLGKLGPYAVNGIPIVGVEPSCTAVLRDDLLDLVPDDPRAHAVAGAVHTLAEVLATVPEEEQVLPDLTGVEVVAQPHCHHHSVMGWAADRALLDRLGARVTQLDGCCGLAGNFGMERGHYEVSVAVAEDGLLPALEEHPGAVYLADGFSCRTQAEQLADRGGMHLAALLAGGAPTRP
ncbi:FAD-binding and (Fe-S)-binding domain-containing protein [Actinomyces polynesiensis]|uniref:FAD-binding and (Fe-S)-binding domain-containing protein n=1 Tax=Actinomyces polynesiensis TaxID=1325934 RepID=UPI0009E65C4B|nr:FAD-binding and (Fe-S)-binding domain-containing protein [Actinomyces polynesiensis]